MAATRLTPKDVLMKPAVRTRGGARVPHCKNTMECETVVIDPPEFVVIPMQQHIGAPCTPLVKKGDFVYVGQRIAESDKFVSAPIHSSVSGTVEGIVSVQMSNGVFVDGIKIKSDGQMTPYPELKPFEVNSRQDLVNAAKECGLVGLGGAGFPAHIKLMPPKNGRIDTLIINAAECEPFITSDYRECMENADNIIKAVFMMLKYMEVDRVIIAVEDNKPKAIDMLVKIACDDRDVENRVRVMKLRSHYPQGAEKILVQAVTGKRIPMGKLPADVGCAVMNITSLAVLYKFITTGMPLVAKRLTIDGTAVKEPKNVLVPIGMSIKEVFEKAGGFKCEPAKILMGGPMMGIAVPDIDAPVLKQNNALLAFCEVDDVTSRSEEPCIRCGRCASVCPMNLVPTSIERFARLKDADELNRIGVSVCMECGSCAYSCPAHRPLTQYMRVAKEVSKGGK